MPQEDAFYESLAVKNRKAYTLRLIDRRNLLVQLMTAKPFSHLRGYICEIIADIRPVALGNDRTEDMYSVYGVIDELAQEWGFECRLCKNPTQYGLTGYHYEEFEQYFINPIRELMCSDCLYRFRLFVSRQHKKAEQIPNEVMFTSFLIWILNSRPKYFVIPWWQRNEYNYFPIPESMKHFSSSIRKYHVQARLPWRFSDPIKILHKHYDHCHFKSGYCPMCAELEQYLDFCELFLLYRENDEDLEIIYSPINTRISKMRDWQKYRLKYMPIKYNHLQGDLILKHRLFRKYRDLIVFIAWEYKGNANTEKLLARRRRQSASASRGNAV